MGSLNLYKFLLDPEAVILHIAPWTLLGEEIPILQDLDFEGKAKEKATQKLGYQPRFMQAGFEYIKQWFREVEGKDIELSGDLPEEVKAVVATTLD